MGGAVRVVTSYVAAWPLWKLSKALIVWIAVVVLAAVSAVAAGVATTTSRSDQVLIWLAFLGLGLVSVESSHRLRHPAGVSKDLLTVWALPVVFLLPPVYAVLLPVPLMLFRQIRATRLIVYRRVFSTAAIGLSDGLVSWTFHRFLLLIGSHGVGATRADRSLVLLVAVACATLGCAINVVLIGISVRFVAPETTWRQLLLDSEQLVIDGVEIALGVVVTACWLATPLLVLLALPAVLMVQRGLIHAQLRAAARQDAKTGLLNARAWQEEADREIARAQRQHRPLTILIVDIDHFKRVNDAHGHLTGDAALMAVVTALLGGLRPYDQLGRFGGEEFTVLLPGTTPSEGRAVAERLRRAVGDRPLSLDRTAVELTVSIGVASLGAHGHDLTDLLTAADHALYRAKQAGRDQVMAAG